MASDICLADTDASTYNIENPAEFTGIPNSITVDYTIHVTSEPPSRSQAEIDLLSSPLCPALDPSYGVLHRKNVAVSAIGGVPDRFMGTCTWERWNPESTGEEFLGGSVSIQTETVYRAYERIGSYPANDLPKIDTHNLINVTRSAEGNNGGVAGVDFPYAVLTFSIRKTYAPGTFTLALLKTLNGYVGRPNSVAWRDFDIGEVRIVGIDGSNQDPEQDEITWTFEAIENEADIFIPSPLFKTTQNNPSGITVPAKRGFDYLWLMTQSWPSPNGFVVEAPREAYVDQITPYVNLNDVV